MDQDEPSLRSIMNAESDLRKELDSLKKKKVEAQRQNHSDIARHVARMKNADKEQQDAPEDVPSNEMEWTPEQWLKHGAKKRKSPLPGYKNSRDLAYSTYKKEISSQSVDIEKYKRRMEENSDPFTKADENDAEKVASLLQEAGKRRQRKRTNADQGGSYINEKNRQFNMKLDREYGA